MSLKSDNVRFFGKIGALPENKIEVLVITGKTYFFSQKLIKL